MQNHCVAPECSNSTSSLLPLFRFPKDEERCKKWIHNCHKDVQDKSPDQLYRYYRLCEKHFEPSMVVKSDLLKIVLKDDAIPTIFNESSEPQRGLRKRNQNKLNDDSNEHNLKKKNLKKEDNQPSAEENKRREYFKSLFEVLVVLGKQNIALDVPSVENEENPVLSNFHAFLEYHNSGEESLEKGSEANTDCCTPTQLQQMIEVCEDCIRNELLEEVKESGFFSLVTDELVKISGEWHLPVFLRFVNQANFQKERFVGFLSFEGDEETLTERLLSDLTQKWGLDMECCRGQAHCTSVHSSKIKKFANQLGEKYPLVVHTPRSSSVLNISLANGMNLTGVKIVICTLKEISLFFKDCPSLQSELEHAISIFYQDKEEKANELKEACQTNWTNRHDAFEVAVDIIESLLLCVDSVHDNEDLRWSDEVTHNALRISEALADFEFVVSLVVLKNTLSLTRAFGKNLQGEATDAFFAANSLTAVLHSLNEVSDNIDVYHEFWYEEAVNLAVALEIPVKVPRLFLRKHRTETGTDIQPEVYYKENLSVPVVNHVINEMKELFGENHLKALRCLSLVPSVIGQPKFLKPEEDNLDIYKRELPNADTLPAELHCWWVKWRHRGKDVTLASSLYETLKLADVKFFPNMLAALRVLGTLPSLVLESSSEESLECYKLYMENTQDKCRSKSLALINIHYDVRHDLDFMVDTYMSTYLGKENM